MARFVGIGAAGKSLERFLNLCFAEIEPASMGATRAVLVRTEDMSTTRAPTIIGTPALSILLYRVDFNKTLRAAWSGVGHLDGRSHLPLDLHFLLTPWARNAEDEHRILGRAMQCLDASPHLSGPLLDDSAGWSPGEGLQVCLAELSTEDVMRTFDTLPLDYKLSVHYLARVVRIDQPEAIADPDTQEVVVGSRAGVGS